MSKEEKKAATANRPKAERKPKVPKTYGPPVGVKQMMNDLDKFNF